MTQPDREYNVVYRALADFSQLIRENARARQSNRELAEEHKKGAREASAASDKVTESERKRAASTGETISATRGARRASEDYTRVLRTEETQTRNTGGAHRSIVSSLVDEAKAKHENVSANKALSDSYDIARRSIDQTIDSIKGVGDQSNKSETRAKSLARTILDSFRSLRLTASDPLNALADPNNRSSTDRPSSYVGQRRRTETPDVTPSPTVSTPNASDSYDLARRSADELSASVLKIGESTDRTDSRVSLFARNFLSNFRRAKDSSEDLRDVVEDVSVSTERVRDNGNDSVGRRSTSLGGDGGRHRIIDDIDGNGGGGSGGGGGGGGITPPRDTGGSGADRSASSWKKLASVIFSMPALYSALATAIGPAIAALSSLSGPILGAANALVSLGGVVAAAPGLFVALGTSIGAVLTAIQPMSNIFDAFKKQQAQVGQGAREMAASEADAAQKVQDATRTHELAERSVSDAQYDAAKAQDNLNHVRHDALISLQDLRMESERGKLDQEGATLSLKRAEQEYAKTMNDPNASLLDREEALHRVKQAQLDERDAKTKNHRTQLDLNDAEKRGVDLNRNVIDATHQRDLANRGVADSQYALAQSVKALAKAQQEQAAGGATALAANNAYKDALDKASPSTRKVAEGILAMNGAWEAIQKSVSEKLFAPFVDQLGSIKSFLPVVNQLLSDAAGALGDVGAKGVAMVTSGPWQKDFATLSTNNVGIIKSMGGAGLAVADAFRNIAIAAAPFTQWIANAVERVAQGFDDWSTNARKSGSITDFLKTTQDRVSQVFRIMKDIGSVFVSLYTATKPFTDWFLDAVERMTDRWAAWGKSAAKEGSPFQEYLKNIQPMLSAIAGLVSDVAKAWAHIAGSPDNLKGGMDILNTLRTKVLPPLVTVIDDLGKSGVLDAVASALGTILTTIAKFLEGGGSKSLSTFVSVLSGFVSVLSGFLSIPGVIPIIGGLTAALGALAAIKFVNKLPGISHLIEGLGWLIRNKTGFGSILENLPGLLAKAVAAAASLTGLGSLIPNNSGTGTGRNNRNNDGTGGTGGSGTGTGGRHTGNRPNIPDVDLPSGPGGASWHRKGQSPADALYVIIAGGGKGTQSNGTDIDLPDSDKDPAHKNGNTPDEGNETRRNKGKPGAHRAGNVAEELVEDAAHAGGKRGLLKGLTSGLVTAGGFALDAFGLPDITSMFGGGAAKATETAAETAARGGATRAGLNAGAHAAESTVARSGLRTAGRVALSGARLSGLLDPLTLAGTATGLIADYAFKDRKSTGAQGTRAAGAVLTGAGIGATIGSVVPVVGTAIGAGIGAVAGGAYSLYKDKGLRDKVGGAVSKVAGKVDDIWDGAYEGFMKNIGSPIAKWFRDLPKHFSGITDFFTKTIPGFFGHITDFFTKTIPNAVSGFFTKTLPGWFDDLGNFFIHLPDRIAVAIGTMAADLEDFITYQIPHFFTTTIPHWFDELGDSIAGAWNDVSDFFTHDVVDFFTDTIPNWFASIGTAIGGMWNESVVPFFTKTVPNFFTRTIPHWFSNIGHAVQAAWRGVETFFTKDVPKFFTQTIPHWFTHLLAGVRSGWHAVTNFFTKDVPNFFAQTIPLWFHNMVTGIRNGWNAASSFFTKDVPSFFMNTIPTWFQGIGSAISKEVVQPIADFFGGAWKYISKLLGKTGQAYEDEKSKNVASHMNGGWIGKADGGFVPGTYSGTEDQQRVLATPGEFMIRRRVAQKPGADQVLAALNNESVEPRKLLAALSVEGMTGGLNGLSTSSVATMSSMVPAAATAESVTTHNDNSTSRVMTFGDIHNHNPVPETSSKSLRSTVNSLAFRYADDSGGQ